jgi:hypothetical protein
VINLNRQIGCRSDGGRYVRRFWVQIFAAIMVACGGTAPVPVGPEAQEAPPTSEVTDDATQSDAQSNAALRSNPVTVVFSPNAGVVPFGEQKTKCHVEGDELVMDVERRGGDYAMCCVRLSERLDLTHIKAAIADVYARKGENKVEVKLEDGSQQIFVFEQAFGAGRRETPARALNSDQRSLAPEKVCFAAIGDGPAPNELRLYGVTLRSK